MYNVLKGGYNARHPGEFVMFRPHGAEDYVMLLVKSAAFFEIGKEKFQVQPNSMLMIRPGVPYRYYGADGMYINDWLHFDCDRDNFEREYGRLMHTPISLSNPMHYSQYFQHLVWEMNYASENYRESNISMLLKVLLNKLCQEMETSKLPGTYNLYASKLQELRLTMKSRLDKNFTPQELAAALHVSTSYFQALYRDFFGIPFKTDLITMRVEHARKLIAETDLTLKQVAQICGYTNEVHFYRQFKAKTGMTPGECRISI